MIPLCLHCYFENSFQILPSYLNLSIYNSKYRLRKYKEMFKTLLDRHSDIYEVNKNKTTWKQLNSMLMLLYELFNVRQYLALL